jgi:hypothetical protein
MPQISKQIVKEVIETLDAYGCGAHHLDLLPLLDQPEREPVAWECDAGIGLIRYVTDEKYKKFTPTIQKHYKPFTHPASFTPISADMVTDEMINEYLTFMGKASYLSHPDVTYQGTVNHDSPEKWRLRFSKAVFITAVNAYMGAKK